jgi:hypothetical protein
MTGRGSWWAALGVGVLVVAGFVAVAAVVFACGLAAIFVLSSLVDSMG